MDAQNIYYISLLIHNLSFVPVMFLSFIFYFLLFYNIVYESKEYYPKKRKNYLPFVSIHIPVYNDIVAVRCIEKCLELDYPKDRYEIIVIDDSDREEVRKAINNFKDKVRILRRNHREGFKAGALNFALNQSRGEIIVIFDSDEIPPRNFLKRIVEYFVSEDIALVQAKLRIYNSNQNLITKFASLLLSFYYNIILPIFYKNGVYHCAGSAVAIRKSVLLRFNGWNQKSVTEDMDLSLKLIINKYKGVYLKNLEVKAEVPNSLISFLKQQARWTFGLVRSFIENWHKILFYKYLNFRQKFLLFFQTFLGYFLGIFILVFTFSGVFVFLFGEPRQANINDLINTLVTFFLTSGFLFSLISVISKERIKIKFELPLILLTLGLLLVINNTIYFLKAFLTDKFYWHVTPKTCYRKNLEFSSKKKIEERNHYNKVLK